MFHLIFRQRPIAKMVALALSSVSMMSVSYADQAKEQDRVVVTGSRIKRTQVEGATSVVIMTQEEMREQGFNTLHEALRSITSATGSFTGEQSASGFQPNAQGLNLRGLGPGRTLILLDGRRIADYPSPYNGESNFVSLSHIPLAMVSHVEIMTGGASAIYGSDAMAGVVNIITHNHLAQATLALGGGDTERGGAAVKRAQWYGGHQTNNLNNIWAIEYFQQEPLLGGDRPLSGLRELEASLQASVYDFQTDQYLDLINDNSCADLGFSYHSDGYCAQYSSQFKSLVNDKRRINFFDRMSFEQGDFNELFLEVHFWDIDAKSNSGPLFWQPDLEFLTIDNMTDQNLFYVNLGLREFSQQEVGDTWAKHSEYGTDLKVGFKGLIQDTYDFEVVLSHSFQDATETQTLIREEAVLDFFRGSQVGSINSLPVYMADLSRLNRPLTSDEIGMITGVDETQRFSSVSSLSFVSSGDLMALGEDYAQFASVIEYANQTYDIDLHPRTLNTQGNGWVGHTGTEGEGSRNRYALGLETRWPINRQLNLTVAGRYDKYDDDTSVDDAWTYNLGVEYRPTESLLIRAANSSNFRAPDMHYVFAATGGSYRGSQVFQQTHANKELEEEKGHTSSLGVVYQPTDHLSFSVDFYQIDLENLIEVHNGYAIALTYEECSNGQPDFTFGGYDCSFVNTPVSYDNGQTFVDRVAIVNGIYEVQVEPINTAKLKQSGVDTSLKYTWVTDEYGIFNITANHTNVLKSERQLMSDSSVNTDWRDDPTNPDLRSRFRATTSWQHGNWQVALLSNRIGSLNSQARRESWTLYNLTGIYSINHAFDVQLSIQNLTDEYPRYGTSDSFPFYNAQHYNALGRQWFLEARYTY